MRTLLLLQAKALVEPINASTSVNQLLLAGVERVALGADFNSDVLLGGTGRKDVATSATDRSLFVIGMDTFLHVVHLFLVISKGADAPAIFNRPDIITHHLKNCKHFF